MPYLLILVIPIRIFLITVLTSYLLPDTNNRLT